MRVFFAILASSFSVAVPVWGCGVCSSLTGNPLSLPHPRAIEIALATRAALDKGLLRRQPLEGKTSDGGWNLKAPPPSGLDAIATWLEAKNIGKSSADRRTGTLHIVMIDTSEIVAVHFRTGEAILELQPKVGCDAVVATTSHGLHAILSRELNLGDAVKLDVAIIEGSRSIANNLAP